MIQKKNLVLWTILALITCGVGALVWFFLMASDVKKVDESRPSAIIAYLLIIVTCGIYGLFFWYKSGEAVGKRLNEENVGLITLLLSVFTGVGGYIYLQYQLNKLGE